MKKTVLFLLSLLLLAGCKTQVTGLQQHPSFTYQQVAQDQFIVAGVVSMVNPFSDLERIRLGEMLSRSFREERKELQLIQTGMLLKRLGPETFTNLLGVYQQTGVITAADVEAVKQLLPHGHYLVLCRVEKNHVFQDHNKQETDVADSEEDREKGEFEYVRVDLSLTTTREIGASMLIYDLQQDLAAWSGFVTKSATNSNSSSRTFSKQSRWREELMDVFVDSMIGLETGYPLPPSTDRLLEQVFEGFAENMPEKKR